MAVSNLPSYVLDVSSDVFYVPRGTLADGTHPSCYLQVSVQLICLRMAWDVAIGS